MSLLVKAKYTFLDITVPEAQPHEKCRSCSPVRTKDCADEMEARRRQGEYVADLIWRIEQVWKQPRSMAFPQESEQRQLPAGGQMEEAVSKGPTDQRKSVGHSCPRDALADGTSSQRGTLAKSRAKTDMHGNTAYRNGAPATQAGSDSVDPHTHDAPRGSHKFAAGTASRSPRSFQGDLAAPVGDPGSLLRAQTMAEKDEAECANMRITPMMHRNFPVPQAQAIAQQAEHELVNPNVVTRMLHTTPPPPAQARVQVADGQRANETVATMMLRNIPYSVTQQELQGLMDQKGFQGLYDYVWMPQSKLSQTRTLNRGYVFINFRDPGVATAFRREFTGYVFSGRRVPKAAVVVPAVHQGCSAPPHIVSRAAGSSHGLGHALWRELNHSQARAAYQQRLWAPLGHRRDF